MNRATAVPITRVQQRQLNKTGYAIHEMEFYSTSEHSTHFISYRYRNVEAGCLSLQQSGRENQNLVCQAGVNRN